MAILDQRQEAFVFRIPAPRYYRMLGLFLFAVVAAPLGFIYSKIGLGWIQSALIPSLFVMVTMVVGILFSLWLLFPPPSSLARFEFTRDHVRYIPNFVARKIGEPSQEAAISQQTEEILLCYRVWPGQQSGYRIIVRAANGNECELGSHSPHTHVALTSADAHRLAEAIAPATGQPARLVIRRKSAGAVEELPWTPPVSRTNTILGVGASAAVLPFVGGILMGWLSPSPAIVVAVGLALWLCTMLAFFAFVRTDHKRFPVLYALTTMITFGATYSVCFVVTSYLTHPQ